MTWAILAPLADLSADKLTITARHRSEGGAVFGRETLLDADRGGGATTSTPATAAGALLRIAATPGETAPAGATCA